MCLLVTACYAYAMKTFSLKKRGFTIVELLIVIVVIGILAAISIVAYNNMQRKAENSKTASALNAYKKILTQYYTLNDRHFTTGGSCLGDQYPLLSATAEGCRYSTAVLPNMSASVKNTLNEVSSTFPMPSSKKHTNSAGTIDYSGMWFYGTSYNYKIDGEAKGWIMYVYNDTACPEQSYVLTTSGSGGYDATPSPASANRYGAINSNTVLCLSPLQ